MNPILLLAFTLLSFLPSIASAQSCPVINGTFKRESGKAYKFTMYTRQAGGVFSYTVDKFGGGYIPADEKPKPISINGRSGKLVQACRGGKLVQVARPDDSSAISRITLTPINDRKVEVDSNADEQSGTYIKL
jgi:hypothetical protein